LSLHRQLLGGDGPVEVGDRVATNVTRPACYDYPHRFSFLARKLRDRADCCWRGPCRLPG